MGLLALLLLGFIGLFVGIYGLGMFYAASKGWSKLAQRFRFNEELDGQDLGWPDLYIGESNYKKGVQLYATPRGLQLKVHFAFALAHPPLLIPWSEIEEATQEKPAKYHFTRLVFGSKEQVSVDLPTHIYEQMQVYLMPGGTTSGILN